VARIVPVVWKMADTPCLVTPEPVLRRRNPHGIDRGCTLPSVLFLNPTGIERPEASSRCTWLSVVRAPMAATR